MKNVRICWVKLPSGLLVGVDVRSFALAPDALQTENGDYVSLRDLAPADRAAVYARYEGERMSLEERLNDYVNGTQAVGE